MSDLALDSKYLGIIASSLPLFKWVRLGRIARCRCIICGDSRKDKTKTRGFFYTDKNSAGLHYKCHNCSISMSFSYFLKTQFPEEYKEYRLEAYRTSGNRPVYTPKEEPAPEVTPVVTPEVKPVRTQKKYDWRYVSELMPDHPAKQYCIGRGMTDKQMSKIVYAKNFRDWVATHIGEVEKEPPWDERLIFPFIDENGLCFGAQGRKFVPCEDRDRFKSAMSVNAKLGKVFGLERINKDSPVIVVEGVVDSLFLPNCVAICGGDINDFFKTLSKKVFVVLDNEPRSKDTVARMEKAINDGFTVVFWDIDTKFKDINDMILKGGMTPKDIIKHIAEHSYSGVRAKAKLAFWKKL